MTRILLRAGTGTLPPGIAPSAALPIAVAGRETCLRFGPDPHPAGNSGPIFGRDSNSLLTRCGPGATVRVRSVFDPVGAPKTATTRDRTPATISRVAPQSPDEPRPWLQEFSGAREHFRDRSFRSVESSYAPPNHHDCPSRRGCLVTRRPGGDACHRRLRGRITDHGCHAASSSGRRNRATRSLAQSRRSVPPSDQNDGASRRTQ